jgi:indole-3-glycerol phosphate synthase
MQIRRRSPSPTIDVKHLRYRVNVPDASPRHILEEIVWHKETEIGQMRERTPLADLQQKVRRIPSPKDFIGALRQGKTQPALIAEVKKASPSKGVIRDDFDPVAIAQSYQQAGASCISVLTDRKFFQGSFDYLEAIRQAVDLPLLCKDFLIYPYQIYLARSHGADAVLLIAAILSDKDLRYFVKIAHALGMATLVEVHTLEELDRVLAIEDINLVGINNRDLKQFTVDLQTTCQLLDRRRQQIQKRGLVVVSESGIHHSNDVIQLREAGTQAILVGESLMRCPDPGEAIAILFALP